MAMIIFVICVSSLACCLVCSSSALESAELLALLCAWLFCVYVTFPYGVLGQVWYLIASIPDLCLLTY